MEKTIKSSGRRKFIGAMVSGGALMIGGMILVNTASIVNKLPQYPRILSTHDEIIERLRSPPSAKLEDFATQEARDAVGYYAESLIRERNRIEASEDFIKEDWPYSYRLADIQDKRRNQTNLGTFVTGLGLLLLISGYVSNWYEYRKLGRRGEEG
jgi:hypothetical protein